MTKFHGRDVITIIIIGLLTFGLQIPWLGFFQDDWNFVFYSSTRGTMGLTDFLLLDGRPGAAWVYELGFAILGYRPALWQLFSLTLRVLTTVVFWMILYRLWPGRRYGNLVASIFFLTYPFFTLQPLSVAYAPHFMAYLIYALSILCMIEALLKPEKYLFFTIPAVLLTFVHLFTVEYFIGLELLRPLILWFLLARTENLPWRGTLQRVFKAWLPYLLTFVFFAGWRTLFLPRLGARHDLLATVSDWGPMLLTVARNAIADWVLMFLNAWFNLINPKFFVIGPVRNLYYLAIVLVGGLCFYFLAKTASREASPASQRREVVLWGAVIFVAGMLSAYSVGYIVNEKIAPWNSRFVLPAMLGLALLISGVVELLVTSKKTRHLCFTILVGLLVGWHNYNTLDFKTAWEKQSRFYEQLVWRAPSIQPGTAIVASEEILGYMGDYPTSYGINTMYGSDGTGTVPLWFFALSENFRPVSDPATGETELDAQRGLVTFRGKPEDAIYIKYDPENKECLWVLRPQDAEYRYLPEALKKAARSSNYQNILPQQSTSALFQTIVPENKDTWCYFYQKADLARQLGDPEVVVELWQQAQSRGLRPDSGFEYLPFIEAFARLNRWDQAFRLTKNANKTTQAMYFMLCPTWQELERSTPASSEKTGALAEAYDLLGCVPE